MAASRPSSTWFVATAISLVTCSTAAWKVRCASTSTTGRRPASATGRASCTAPAPCSIPNGKVSAQLAFVDGKLHGPVSFHAAEGWLQRKAHYRNGLLHGEALNYFANGQVAEREHYRDGGARRGSTSASMAMANWPSTDAT
ncbi:phophatidylinositol-4-phosphate 5-kinase [Pseudomonas aeruginosa]|nr:phophatidylinositol-4-phosphate 5-kinase [Pseudomonas aeruginosa]